MNPVEVMESNEEFMDESQELVDSRTVASQNNEATCPTLTKTVINEATSRVEIFDSSNNSTKIRKTPCTRSKDFFMVTPKPNNERSLKIFSQNY